jgi:hypothetical protein
MAQRRDVEGGVGDAKGKGGLLLHGQRCGE